MVNMRSYCPFQGGDPSVPSREAGVSARRPYIACLYVVVWVVKWRHFLAVGRVFAKSRLKHGNPIQHQVMNTRAINIGSHMVANQ